jgi:hypothetical protein
VNIDMPRTAHEMREFGGINVHSRHWSRRSNGWVLKAGRSALRHSTAENR